jgi:hypothetical protein
VSEQQPVMVKVVKHLTCTRCKVKSQTIKNMEENLFNSLRERDPTRCYINDKTTIQRQVVEDYVCAHCK